MADEKKWDILETAKATQFQFQTDEYYKTIKDMSLEECIVLSVLRKNEVIPSPCTYYEEDNCLISGLVQISKEIIKELDNGRKEMV